MPTKLLKPVCAWVKADVKKALVKEIARQPTRMSVSSYVEALLRRHLEAKGSI